MNLNIKSKLSRQTVITVLCSLIFTHACSQQPSPYQQKQTQDQWLEQNINKKENTQQLKPAIKTEYFNEILTGKLTVGMTLQDVLATTQREPFGKNKYPLLFWCDATLSKECDTHCKVCSAVMLTQNDMLLMRGRGAQLNLEKTLQRSSDDNEDALRKKSLAVILGLFSNQATVGMSASDFERIKFTPQSRTRYFCNGSRIFSSCLRQCVSCQIDIISRQDGQFFVQSIYLKGMHDFQTITDIESNTTPTID